MNYFFAYSHRYGVGNMTVTLTGPITWKAVKEVETYLKGQGLETPCITFFSLIGE